MIPAKYDFEVWRGTAGPTQGIRFRLQNSSAQPIPLDDVRLSIYKRSALLLRVALSDPASRLTLTDGPTGEYTWSPSTEDTRLIPEGQKSDYEIEIWNGPNEIVFLYGKITGSGGINDDEDDPS